jgi:hypothetical protein
LLDWCKHIPGLLRNNVPDEYVAGARHKENNVQDSKNNNK